MITQLSKDLGKTLMVSSHLLSEIEVVADSMLIIDKGKKVVEGRINLLLNPERSIVELVTSGGAGLAFIDQSEWKRYVKTVDKNIIRMEFNKERIPELNRQLVEKGIPVESIRPVHSLEDYFLSQTKL